VIELTEPQIWTMIGVFTALMFGMLTLVSTLFVRVVRSEVGGLRGELLGEIGGLRAEMRARFEAVDARFDAVHVKIDGLDRDVQLLMRREFGIDRE
jgi:Lysis protein S.